MSLLSKRAAFLVSVTVALVTIENTYASEDYLPDIINSNTVKWQLDKARSDSFNHDSLNTNKWVNNPKDLVIGAWTFDERNAWVEGGVLNIAATQETHKRKFRDACWDGIAGGQPKVHERTLFYKSGAVKTKADGIYGYYEASIKGVKLFPGLSPAFWLYSDGPPFDDAGQPGTVDYSEIDIVELQQADWHGPKPDDADAINVTDHNLHARIFDENGKKIWLRPKPNRDTQLLNYEAPFDPSEGFHTYAVENRRDRIFWYVDGKLVGSQANTYWHRPMHVIFSMGLRRQFIFYNANCQRADPNPAATTAEGFPENTTMQVDYVKTYKALPSIWLADEVNTITLSNVANNNLTLNIGYHGGSDHYVDSAKYNGITVNIVEKNQDGAIRTVASGTDATASHIEHRYGGNVSIDINLDKVLPSAELKTGHFYAIVPVFRSSNGYDIFPQQIIEPVTVVH